MLLASPLPGVYDDKASVASSAVVGTNELVGGAGFKIDQAAKVRARVLVRALMCMCARARWCAPAA